VAAGELLAVLFSAYVSSSGIIALCSSILSLFISRIFSILITTISTIGSRTKLNNFRIYFISYGISNPLSHTVYMFKIAQQHVVLISWNLKMM